MATTVSHPLPTTQAHAIAGLTGYEDTDTLRWQPPCTGTQDGDAGTGPDGRAPRGPAPTGHAASWPTSEAPASMNVKLKVGPMEIMYTARDTNDRDLQDRMTRVLPWLAEVMAACEATYDARRQAAKQTAEPPIPPPPPAPERECTLEKPVATAVQAAMQDQATASPNGAGPAAEGRRASLPPPASERTNDMDPSWCAIHTCTMEQHSNARGIWWSHYLGTDAHGKRRYCKGE
jgi:hypothetical protein